MESSNSKSYFGVPNPQVQNDYVYVPSTSASNEQSETFVLEHQLPKLSNSIGKRIEEMPASEMQTNFSTISPLELNLQSNVTLTENSMGIPLLPQNFQIVTQQTKGFSEIVSNPAYHSEEVEKVLSSNNEPFREVSDVCEDYKFIVKSEDQG